MSFTIFEQIHILLYSVLFGCISGIAFCVYGTIYRNIHSKIIRFFSDVILSALFSMLYFMFVVILCKGRVSVFQIVFYFRLMVTPPMTKDTAPE